MGHRRRARRRGDAEIAAAWEEMYWVVAYTLLHIERGIDSTCGVRPQTVWREWEVQQEIRETTW